MIERLFHIIQIPFHLKTTDQVPYYSKLCLYSYRLLGCIVAEYPKNRYRVILWTLCIYFSPSLAVAENLSFLASQLPVTESPEDPLAIEIVNLLKAIFRDNRFLVRLRDITQKFLDTVCKLVFRTKNIL